MAHLGIRLTVHVLHHSVQLLYFLTVLVARLRAERNPADVLLVILTLVDALLDFVLQTAELGQVLLLQAVHVVNVVPQEVFVLNVVVEVFVSLLQLK